MKHRLLVWSSFLVLLLTGTPAFAGDLWSGFYFGGNAGYAWGSGENTLTVSDGAICHFTCPGGTDAASAAAAGSPSLSPAGFSGGLQLGYNWQIYNWVYGLETDFSAFSQNRSSDTSTGLPANTAALDCNFGDPCVGNFSTSVKTDWLFTFRPRLGYTWDSTLLYVTGGLAVSRIAVSQSYSDNNPSNAPLAMVSYSGAQTKAGWIVGGGIEHALNERWSLKAEYLFVRFDNINAGGRLTDSIGGYADFSDSLRFSSNIVRVGFNYRFGGVPQ
jgi:outer membrane immunogenic protein